jgi:predicted O-linked N-acetylglucosamine transferase (SPINDLY family)
MMRQAIERFPDQSVLHDGLAMFSCYDDQLSPREVFDIHKAFGQCVQSQVRVPRRYQNKANADKRVRIGFVSSDFKTHSIAYFLEPIFDHLDHNRFELCVYSTSSYADQMTDRLRSKSDLWRECTSGVAQTHQRIVNDHVDVLVELNGHFASNSLPIFAAKPAPVSVTMIGYANTTGLSSIDARLIDEVTDPSPAADELATEKLVRLPGCFLCYRPSAFRPAIQEQKADRAFTFGSFNDLRKISPSTLKAWANILARCPLAKLLLKTSRFSNSEVCDDMIERFNELGVDRSQVVLTGRMNSIVDHLDLYNTIDCALDTFPYTGTTTTCEALSLGVPTVTLMGESHAGRVSASLLTTIGREDLVADTVESYIDLAVAQAGRGLRSVEERAVLCKQLEQSPLCDEVAYTKKFENAINHLWGDWCQKQQEGEAST